MKTISFIATALVFALFLSGLGTNIVLADSDDSSSQNEDLERYVETNIVVSDKNGWRYNAFDLTRTSYSPDSTIVELDHMNFTVDWEYSNQATLGLTGDLDNDGDLELVFSSNQKIFAINDEGSLVWERIISGDTRYQIVVCFLEDMDNDGDLEIFAGNKVGTTLQTLILDHNGNILTTLMKSGSSDSNPPHPIGVIEQDGYLKLLTAYGTNFGRYPRGVSSFNLTSGSEEWHYAFGPWPDIKRFIVDDIDQDGTLEILLGGTQVNNGAIGRGTGTATQTNDGKTYSVMCDEYGNEEFTILNGDLWRLHHMVSDLDGDGEKEIILFESGRGPYNGYSSIQILNETGSSKHSYTGPYNLAWYSSGIADLDNDGINEIILSNQDGNIYIFNDTLILKRTTSISIGTYSRRNDFAINDINGDGKLEIIGLDHGSKTIRVLDNELNQLWSYYYDCSLWGFSISDNDGNGVNDIVLWGDKIISLSYPENHQSDLVGFWDFDEEMGLVANDQSEYLNDGLLTYCPQRKEGKFGNSLDFDGDDDLVMVDDDWSLDLKDEISIEAWINTEGSTGDHQVILSKWYDDGTSDHSYVLELQPNGKTLQLVLGGGIANGGLGPASASIDVEIDEWYHVVGTYDGSSVKLFINGKQTCDYSTSGNIPVSESPVIIGAHDHATDRNDFNGRIDEVKLYSYALSKEEIKQNYLEIQGYHWKTLYETDFSENPEWITNNDDRYYWDDNTETYKLEMYDNTDEYTFKNISYSGGSQIFEYDMIIENINWAGNFHIGLWEDTMKGYGNDDTHIQFSFGVGDLGKGMQLYAKDDEDNIQYWSQYPTNLFDYNVWYTFKIEYDHLNGSVRGTIANRNTGDIFFDQTLNGLSSFNKISRIAASKIGDWYSANARGIGQIDNIRFQELVIGNGLEYNWKTTYESDFSTDPEWITNNENRYSWDSDEENYDAVMFDNSDEYSYVNISYHGGSFKFTHDVMIDSINWAGNLHLGLRAPSMKGYVDPDQMVELGFNSNDQGKGIVFSVVDNSGEFYRYKIKGPNVWKADIWYQITIEYSQIDRTILMNLYEKDDMDLVASRLFEDIEGFDDISCIAASKVGDWYSSSARGIGQFDNVMLEELLKTEQEEFDFLIDFNNLPDPILQFSCFTDHEQSENQKMVEFKGDLYVASYSNTVGNIPRILKIDLDSIGSGNEMSVLISDNNAANRLTHFTCFFVLGDYLYFGHTNGTLYRYDGSNVELIQNTPFSSSNYVASMTYFEDGGFGPKNYNGNFCVFDDGSLYFGASSGNLYRFNGQQFQLVHTMTNGASIISLETFKDRIYGSTYTSGWPACDSLIFYSYDGQVFTEFGFGHYLTNIVSSGDYLMLYCMDTPHGPSSSLWQSFDGITFNRIHKSPGTHKHVRDSVNIDGFDYISVNGHHPYGILKTDETTFAALSSPEFIFQLETTNDYLYILSFTRGDPWGYTTHDLRRIPLGELANEPPVAETGGPYTAGEGTTIFFNASRSSDPDGDPLKFRWDIDGDGFWDSDFVSNPTIDGTWFDEYEGTVYLEVSDGELTTVSSTTVSIVNVAPEATLNSNSPVNEGSEVIVSFSDQNDPGIHDTFTYSIDWNNDGVFEIIDQNESTFNHTWYDNGIFIVNGRIKDNDGGYTDCNTTVNVNNVAPIVSISYTTPLLFLLPGENVTFFGIFSDPGLDDTHDFVWEFGDGYYSADNLTINHSFATAGVYTVKLTVIDDDGGCSNTTVSIKVSTPGDAVSDLISFIKSLKLKKGTENSLLAKLKNLNFNGNSAENKLHAFINHVHAQSGKKIPVTDAETMVYLASRIIEVI